MTDRRSPTPLGWIALALVGLVVAVAVSYAASRLASTKVGLTSEPLSAGLRLAPTVTTPSPAPSRPPAATQPSRPANPPTGTGTAPSGTTPSGGSGGDDGSGGRDD